MNTSFKIYASLVIILALFAGLSVIYASPQLLPTEELPASKSALALINAAMMIFAYGGLGLLGLKLSKKLGFRDIWDKNVSNKQRFLVPAVIGGGIGAFFILADMTMSQFHSMGALPHPDFPLSVIASITAAIGEEVIFRLFFIPFWLWLLSWAIFKKRYLNQLFWIVSGISALAFAFGHIPSVMALLGLENINQIPPSMMAEIVVLNVVISIPAAYYFRKYGFLAAVGIHFWTDIIWHVIYGLL